MRSQILFLVLCLSIALVNAWDSDEDPLELEGNELLSYSDSNKYKAMTSRSLWKGYDRLYQYSKKAIPVVNQFAILVNKQHKNFDNAIQTDNVNDWNDFLGNLKNIYGSLVHESSERLNYIHLWIVDRRPYLDQNNDYKILTLIDNEIKEEKNTINFIKEKLDEGVSLLEKLLKIGKPKPDFQFGLSEKMKQSSFFQPNKRIQIEREQIINQVKQIEKEIATKTVGKKTVDAVSLIRGLREQYKRFNFTKHIDSKQSNLVDTAA